MISIVVPCLNEQDHITAFLLSCRVQKFQDFEVIVVDGGSTDETLEILDKASRWRNFSLQLLTDKTRNIGYIRNLGALAAKGEFLLHTNTDVILPCSLLHSINFRFSQLPDLAALSGCTWPIGGGPFCFAGYKMFDLLRSWMARLGRFSPSGNFLAIRKDVFRDLGGFPEVQINEDGKLGIELSEYCRKENMQIRFEREWGLWHYAKRFEGKGLQAIMFYFYVFGNFSRPLSRLFESLERKSGVRFADR